MVNSVWTTRFPKIRTTLVTNHQFMTRPPLLITLITAQPAGLAILGYPQASVHLSVTSFTSYVSLFTCKPRNLIIQILSDLDIKQRLNNKVSLYRYQTVPHSWTRLDQASYWSTRNITCRDPLWQICRLLVRLLQSDSNMIMDWQENLCHLSHWCLRHFWNWANYSVNLISTEIRYFYWQ